MVVLCALFRRAWPPPLAENAGLFKPLLELGMRLGEGSGAAAAMPSLRAAPVLHARMAMFAEAGVSQA